MFKSAQLFFLSLTVHMLFMTAACAQSYDECMPDSALLKGKDLSSSKVSFVVGFKNTSDLKGATKALNEVMELDCVSMTDDGIYPWVLQCDCTEQLKADYAGKVEDLCAWLRSTLSQYRSRSSLTWGVLDTDN